MVAAGLRRAVSQQCGIEVRRWRFGRVFIPGEEADPIGDNGGASIEAELTMVAAIKEAWAAAFGGILEVAVGEADVEAAVE